MSDTDRPGGPPPYLELMRPKPTGHVLVTFTGEDETAQLRALERGARRAAEGRRPSAHVVTAEAAGDVDFDAIDEPVLLHGCGIGLAPATTLDRGRLMAAMRAEDGVLEARPEFYMYAIEAMAPDTAARTWGVAAVGAETSPYAGRGVRIAVLDTGLDLAHPDFAGRAIVARSFVAGEGPQDRNGHGTHCAGTAAGPRASGARPRYGVAPEAELYVAKVLGDAGAGREIDILAGMAWAIEQGCAVISMSLGRPTQPGEAPSLAYERLGTRALAAGALILAAAGNESARQFGFIAPVGAPANSPSILAVAAVDGLGGVADFSCGGLNDGGGAVDLAGPGVDVLSAAPAPRLHQALSGTSMACPHAAGVAALWAESDPALRGEALWRALVAAARPLSGAARDVGAGLVQAPQAPRA